MLVDLAMVVGSTTRVEEAVTTVWLWEIAVGMIVVEDKGMVSVAVVRSLVSRLTRDGKERQGFVALCSMILVEVTSEVWRVVAVIMLVLFIILMVVEETHLVENLVSKWVLVTGASLVSQNLRQLPTLQSFCWDKKVKPFPILVFPNTARETQNNPHTANMLEVVGQL